MSVGTYNLTLILLLGVLLAGCAPETSGRVEGPTTLASLLALPAADRAKVDIARMNLLCEEGLAGGKRIPLDNALEQLDTWAQRVKAETRRHQYRFERDPGEFDGSPGFFRLLMLGVVLAEDYQVQYHPDLRAGPQVSSAHDGFFADARSVFLSGLLGGGRQGTCSSLPVLYVATGRRLGYPVKLVTTRGHLFVRWEGAGERFNVEVTGQGLNRFPDEYYRHWPFEVSEKEVQAEGYLRSLSPPEELAVFLSIRAMCLREAGRWSEAGEAFATAAQLAPGVASYRMMAEHCRSEAATEKTTKPNGENS